ncbi:MAG: M48 family metalloprotease [Alphaproteobacteria bacterium]|nr:M48 family metalloprotease [Alphaproteobacteria bacterium]
MPPAAVSVATLPRRALLLIPAFLPAFACTDGGVNLFSIQDDKDLGAQVHEEILADPATYPLVDENDAVDAYGHLYRIRDQILDSGEVALVDEFEWNVYLIDDDETLNAFAAPGGYLYIYSGLMRYLDEEDHFAGVMGHEIAHADERHSTQQLTKIYGISTLVGVILGEDPGLAAEIAAALVSLSFSRQDEAEADEDSVYYLCETVYAANGTAGFFEKLTEEGSVEIPEFLSTHPSSESRVEDINALAEQLGCSTELWDGADWPGVIATLP